MPDASLALDASLAPTQIYIVLAITVATFAWLLKPETLRQLTGLQVIAGGVLVFYQCMHLWIYVALHEIQPVINTVMHGGRTGFVLDDSRVAAADPLARGQGPATEQSW